MQRSGSCTCVGDRTRIDLTVVSPPHAYGAATLLLGDVGGQDAVAEHGVVKVQVTLLLLIRYHSDCCRSNVQKAKGLMYKSDDLNKL